MTLETLNAIHRAYNYVTQSPRLSNIVDILQELKMHLIFTLTAIIMSIVAHLGRCAFFDLQ